jgi:hypothetical protein
MRPLSVVVDDPRVECCLQGVDRLMPAVVIGEELGADRLMQPFDLPGRGRRVRRSQGVSDRLCKRLVSS